MNTVARRESRRKSPLIEKNSPELLKRSPDAMVVFSEDRIIFVNDECLRLMAASSAAEIVGKSVLEFVQPTYRTMVADQINKIRAEGINLPVTIGKFIRLDGSKVDINLKASRIRFEEKPAVQMILQEISHRTKSKKDLKESEQRLKSLVRILQYDANVNELLDFTLEEAIKLTGSKVGYIYFYDELKQEFSLHSWSSEVMKECAIVNKQTIYKLQDTGIWGEAVRQRRPIMVNDFNAENHLKKGYPEGHTHLNSFLTIPIIISGKIVAVIGVGNKVRDYSEADILHLSLLMDSTWKSIQKKKLEEFLNLQNIELKKLNTNKDQLISILAHDLRNPFNALLGLSELLSENIRNYDIAKIEKQAGIINLAAHRIYNLLEDILLWSRSQSGTISFEPEELILLSILIEVIDSLKPNLEAKNISITYRVASKLKIFADADMLKTILRNIISNAIKFTGAGGSIQIKAAKSANSINVKISDNGIGIKGDQLKHLFEGSQIHSSAGTENEKGTGLGLLLCKTFLEKHAGKIWAESNQGKGSSFYFSIPNQSD